MKVAIYCRLSEEDRDKQNKFDDSISIQNQKSMLISYALNHEWELYNIYSDDDYTGADRNRPAFNQLLIDAEQKKFDIILCKSQSRFTRELEMVEKYIHGLFIVWGIRFIGMVDNADTSIKGNKKSRQINGLVNEWYLEDLSENIKSALTNRRENGYHIGSFALYGYKKDPLQKGHLIIDDEAAANVHEIFVLFLSGMGKTNIARIFNERNIPNPTEYKRLHGLRFKIGKQEKSTLWRYATIGSILRNEMYIGNLIQGKYANISYKSQISKPQPKSQWIKVEGTHEPIIEKELWDKVQALISLKAKPFTTGEIGIFAKKTRCMYCGYTMLNQKNRQYRYLDCATKYVSPKTCIGGYIPTRELERQVITELKALINEYLDMDQAEALICLNNNSEIKIKQLEKEIQLYTEKLADLNMVKSELYIDKVKKNITESEYLNFANTFSLDINKYDELIKTKNELVELEIKNLSNNSTKKDILKKYVNITELNREIISVLIDYIEIGKRPRRNAEVPIKIHWNF